MIYIGARILNERGYMIQQYTHIVLNEQSIPSAEFYWQLEYLILLGVALDGFDESL